MPAPSGIATAWHRHGPVAEPVKDPYGNRALSPRSARHLLTALGHHQSRMRVGWDVPGAGSNGIRKRLGHARKKVSRRLVEIKGRDWCKAYIGKLLTEMPEGGG